MPLKIRDKNFACAPLISETLAIHDFFHSRHNRVFQQNLGDGYLLRNNLIFHSIRNQLYGRGFKITPKDRFYYQQLKLLALPLMINNREIPLLDNVTSLRFYESRSPKKIRMIVNLFATLPKNFLLHESAHCIAHHLLSGNRPLTFKKNSASRTVLEIILGESFATSVESMGGFLIDSHVHDFFYRCNTYNKIFPLPLKRKVSSIAKKFGIKSLFLLMFYSNVWSLFLKKFPTAKEWEFLSYLIFNKTVSMNKTLSDVFSVALNLSPTFKTILMEQYLSSLNYPGNPSKSRRFNFLEMMLRDDELLGRIREMAVIGTAGIEDAEFEFFLKETTCRF